MTLVCIHQPGCTLPATDGLSKDGRTTTAPAAVTSSFLVPLDLLALCCPILRGRRQHNGTFFMSHWFLSAVTGNLSRSRLTCVLLFFFLFFFLSVKKNEGTSCFQLSTSRLTHKKNRGHKHKCFVKHKNLNNLLTASTSSSRRM